MEEAQAPEAKAATSNVSHHARSPSEPRNGSGSSVRDRKIDHPTEIDAYSDTNTNDPGS